MTGPANDSQAIVRLDHVTKRFDQVVAVDDLDLAIAEGQFVTFLGPSGCGKSTTLRLLGGFETPTRGRIELGGEDITHTPPNRRDLNMVFQDYALFPHMNVERNIAFGLELKGQSQREISQRIESLTDFLGLGELRDRLPEQLSGGQRQRVALARALAPDPKVLLLDEPLGALDAKLRGQVQIELKAIQERTGKTFVFVTHDQEEALTMSDRIIVMNAGRVEQDGTPEDLYQRPASRFVADFIGETNLLDCTVIENGAGYTLLDWRGNQIRATVYADPPARGARVTAALRPENIVCAEREESLPQTATCRVKGRVQRRIFKGAVVTFELALDPQQADTPLRATLDPATAEAIQHPDVWLGWQPERLVVLGS